MKDYTVKILKQDEESITVGGYAVIFGGQDLMGEHFTKSTDLMLDLYEKKPVLWNHNLGTPTGKVGHTLKEKVDEIGLWVEAVIESSNKYIAGLIEANMLADGLIGWSSGSAPQLVQRDRKTGEIKSWGVVEYSLTEKPAEPRTLGVDALKAPGRPESDTTPKKDVDHESEPKSRQKASVRREDTSGDRLSPQHEIQEGQVMNEEMKALSDRVDRILEMLASEPVARDGGLIAPESDGGEDTEVKSLADFLYAVKVGNHDRLTRVYKAAMEGGVGSRGGYLIPDELASVVEKKIEDHSFFRRYASEESMSGLSKDVPVIDLETAPTAGQTANAGGAYAYWVAEAASITESEPQFRNIRLEAHKLAAFALASNEVLDDAPSVSETLANSMGEAIAAVENYGFMRGNGVGQPLGVLNSGAVISVTRSAASAVARADLAGMISRAVSPEMTANKFWVFNPTVLEKLIGISDGVNAWQPNLVEGIRPTLLGLPWHTFGGAPALNTLGDIMLIDGSFYKIGNRKGVVVSYSDSFKFQNDQGAWKVIKRTDGRPVVESTLTLQNASTTVSPFVGLAAG